jgi:outer membrane lipoprotein carrier protein
MITGGAVRSLSAATEALVSLDTILKGVEQRYAGTGFTADFRQTSTIKAMDITDTAAGKVLIKRPEKMRWEYTQPDEQTIVTDGQTLWMYRPEDQQVMVGQAPSFFGDGKGASFLTDMQGLRRNFAVTLEESQNDDVFRLKMLPHKANVDIAAILISVAKETFEVVEIITLNAYEDETLIKLENYDYAPSLSDDLFRFEVPEGVDVLQMEP